MRAPPSFGFSTFIEWRNVVNLRRSYWTTSIGKLLVLKTNKYMFTSSNSCSLCFYVQLIALIYCLSINKTKNFMQKYLKHIDKTFMKRYSKVIIEKSHFRDLSYNLLNRFRRLLKFGRSDSRNIKYCWSWLLTLEQCWGSLEVTTKRLTIWSY